MTRNVELKTGCRLHFGLCPLSDLPNQFAGLGVALKSPGFSFRFCSSEKLGIESSDKSRARFVLEQWFNEFGDRLTDEHDSIDSLPVSIVELDSIPQHIGLGSGTQFGLALTRGLHKFFDLHDFNLVETATQLVRGTRSLVGTVTFDQGGLVWDTGNTHCDLEERVRRCNIPAKWRILLVIPENVSGHSGAVEAQCFQQLPPADPKQIAKLVKLVDDSIIPAVQSEDFEPFARSVFEYGRLAGEFFGSIQGGIYNGPVVTKIVERLTKLGAAGVGQSSWGPCVFSWFDNDESIERFVDDHRSEFEGFAELYLATPSNEGVQIKTWSADPVKTNIQ